jgi:hypothetical protein
MKMRAAGYLFTRRHIYEDHIVKTHEGLRITASGSFLSEADGNGQTASLCDLCSEKKSMVKRYP